MAKSKALKIDMCAGSELKDTQGETLSIEGCDISELEAGRGRFNDNHGKGFFNSLGRVTEAKKILKKEDCENDRHRYYWDKIKAPYVYVAGELYNNEDHPNAKAAAAILRNIHREDAPLSMKASVEGGVLARGISDSSRLARTKLHSVALTFTPANNATLVEPIDLDKSSTDWEADKQLIKSVMHLAETNIPSFRHVTRHASANTIHDNILKIQELAKSLGIDITVNESNPESIMKNAVFHKVASNVNKINELVKAVRAGSLAQVMAPAAQPKAAEPKIKTPSWSETKDAQVKGKDKFDENIGSLKIDSSSPQKPKDFDTSTNTKVKNASQVKTTNTLKTHASKAMRNPDHLDAVHSDLVDRGIHPKKAAAIITKIKSHMLEKSEMEKGVVSGIRNVALLGALAVGANSFDTKKDIKSVKAPESKESKRLAHNAKMTDPDKMIGPVKGYDERKPNAKQKFKESRKKLKEGLKKALTAGYGGAGAPAAMTGGSVMQSQSLDDGRSKATKGEGFDYITCSNCGHEQVYMDHQVKCRECKQNFPLDKLQGHM